MKKPVVFGFAVILTAAALGHAQEAPTFPQPQEEHKWLHKFVGQWNTTSKGSFGLEKPPIECSGTISGRMLGGFWVVNEMKADFMGAPMQGIQTIGYDTAKNRYVGTWVDSMMNHMWQYEGTVEKSGKKLTLEAEGPNFMASGKMTKYRDAYEFKSADRILVTSSMLGEDGKWVTLMTGEAKRMKNKESE